jgi:hypothetical protein
MRSLGVLILSVSFAVVVVLPNEIGTQDLPATNGKHVITKATNHSTKPNKGGPAISLVLIQLEGTARCSGCISEVRMATVPSTVSQHSSPLLI